MAEEKTILYCSFCGKSRNEVDKLIAGPGGYICDGCVSICLDVLEEEGQQSLLSFSGEKDSSDRSSWTSMSADAFLAEALDQDAAKINLEGLKANELVGKLARLLTRKDKGYRARRELARIRDRLKALALSRIKAHEALDQNLREVSYEERHLNNRSEELNLLLGGNEAL